MDYLYKDTEHRKVDKEAWKKLRTFQGVHI
jgi:hypothetical protein